MSIGGRDLLSQIENENPKLGIFLRQHLIPAIETTAFHAGVSPTGNVAAPDPPSSVNVAVAGELMQVTVDHHAPVDKNVHYVYSIATNPQMSGAQIEIKPATRAPAHFSLPTKDGGGTNHNYYVAVQAQYPGSPPSEATYHGGVTPVAVNMGGTTQLDIMPGTGSGTAQNGGQTLVGLGKAQVRLGAK